MDSEQHIWRVWARTLHKWGVKDWAASFLEAAGPLTLLGAQVVYIGQPVLGLVFPSHHLDALARILEQPDQTRAFAAYLREDTAP